MSKTKNDNKQNSVKIIKTPKGIYTSQKQIVRSEQLKKLLDKSKKDS